MALALPLALEAGSILGPEALALLSELGGSAAIGNTLNALVTGQALKMGKRTARELMEDVMTKEGREKIIAGASKLGMRGNDLAKTGLGLLNKVGVLGNRRSDKYKKMFEIGNHHFQSALGKVRKINKFF